MTEQLTETQKSWLRKHGIRRSPLGTFFAAETRGGHGHPIPIIVRLERGMWVCRLGQGQQCSTRAYAELRDALRQLLDWTRLDSGKV